MGSEEQLALSLTRLIEIIGEAAKDVSIELRNKNPDILWDDIAGTRDCLAHGYFDVDYDVVWEIVSVDLPRLIGQLEQLLG